MSTTTKKSTLAQALALALSDEDLDMLCVGDLDLTSAQVTGACAVWGALLGIDADDAEGMAGVRREVLPDAPLLVVLNGPASDFVRWFRRASWGDFERTEVEGGEEWGWRVLSAARACCDRLGALAGQVPMAAERVRGGK